MEHPGVKQASVSRIATCKLSNSTRKIRSMTTATMFPPCPSCGSTDAIRIEYGYPSSELAEAAERGEVILGGCLIWPEAPDFECRGCGSALPWVASDHDADD